jgi:aminopeptidase YwaD
MAAANRRPEAGPADQPGGGRGRVAGHPRRSRVPLAAGWLLCAGLLARVEPYAALNTGALLRELASEAYGGRRSGEAGAELAARRLAELADSLGLAAPAGERLQTFQFAQRVDRIDSTLSVDGLPQAAGWRVLPASASGAVTGEALFCGYGIVQPEAGWDDWSGLDAAGRIAVIVRQGPRGERPDDPAWIRAYAIEARIAAARAAGVRALIVLDNPFTGEEPFEGPDWRLADAGLPLLAADTAFGDLLLGGEGALRTRLGRLNRSRRPEASAAPLPNVSLELRLERHEVPAWTVRAEIPGQGAAAGQTVLLGAHYDHLGRGPHGEGPLHPGADDNASGTALALALAADLQQRIAAGPRSERRRFELALFGGEELGLLGSRSWLARAAAPPELMINLDMVGRLRDDTLHLLGGEDHPLLRARLEQRAAAEGLSVAASAEMPGGGDHVSFRRAGGAAAMIFTGPHADYHRPEDRPERIEYAGIGRLRTVLGGLLEDCLDPGAPLDQPGRLAESSSGEGGPVRVAIGIVPGYESEGGGLPVNFVRPGTPAEAAGLREGDRILALGRFPVTNIFDYTFAIRHFSAGETVEVVLLRGGQRLRMEVLLQERPQ